MEHQNLNQASAPGDLRSGEWLPTVLRSVAREIEGGSPAPGVARHRVMAELADVLDAEERSNLALLVPAPELRLIGSVADPDAVLRHLGLLDRVA